MIASDTSWANLNALGNNQPVLTHHPDENNSPREGKGVNLRSSLLPKNVVSLRSEICLQLWATWDKELLLHNMLMCASYVGCDS